MIRDRQVLRLLILVTGTIGVTAAIALSQGMPFTKVLGWALMAGALSLLAAFGWVLYRLTRPWSPEPPARRRHWERPR